MNNDYILYIPNDLFKIIFGHLHPDSKEACLYVNKKINGLASLALLSEQGLTPNETPYTQLMNFRREYCNFFLRKITPLAAFATVTETKKNIDKTLSHSIDSKTCLKPEKKSLLNESWSRFIIKLAPRCSGEGLIELNSNNEFNDNEVLQPNREAQMYLYAGATDAKLECVFETIMAQIGVPQKPVKLLIKHKFKVDDRTIMAARLRFKEFIPVLIKSCEADSIWLSRFFDLCQLNTNKC